MADIKISQLGAAIAVNNSDLLPIVSNGNTLKAPASLVKEYAVGNTDLSGIGDGTPTGAIAALNTELGTTKQALANEAVTRALTGGHNLLPNNATGQVINGVTFTVNSNTKTVGANGTAQGGNANLFIIGTYTGTTSNAVLTFDKDIILSGGRNENVRVTAFVIHGSSGTVTHYSSTGNHVLIEANGELIYLLGVACQVLNGQTANNDGLYPMIRWATDEYKGYSPYAMTNSELTEKVTNPYLAPSSILLPIDGTVTTLENDGYLRAMLTYHKNQKMQVRINNTNMMGLSTPSTVDNAMDIQQTLFVRKGMKVDVYTYAQSSESGASVNLRFFPFR